MKRLSRFAWLLAAGLASAADEPKTHVLYLGADVSVEWRGAARPVVDAQADQLVVDVDGRRRTLAALADGLPLRLESTLKLSGQSAVITDLRTESTFTAANHPGRQHEMAAALVQGAEAAADLSLGNLRALEMHATHGRADGSIDPAMKEVIADAQQHYAEAVQGENAATNAGESLAAQANYEAHDAVLVTFKLSSAQPMARPYAIAALHYLEQRGNPRTRRVAVYGHPLPRIDEKPRTVTILRGGFPPGFQLERCQVHLYEGGREVPTTASAKRIELTAAEAFEYALVTHLTDLRDATQPPSPARAFWPADLENRLAESNRNRLVFVEVGRDGRALGAFHDETRKLRITDADVIAVLPDLRFLPGVAKGKPVPGVCRVNLGRESL